MSDRIDKSWTVLKSIESPDNDYCVDLFSRPDGTFGFEEFRRDPEDMGRWTGIQYYSSVNYKTEVEAMDSAKKASGVAVSNSQGAPAAELRSYPPPAKALDITKNSTDER